jgi:hypothetical protein
MVARPASKLTKSAASKLNKGTASKLTKAVASKLTKQGSAKLTAKNLEKHTGQHTLLVQKEFATAESAQLAVDALSENERMLLWKKFEQSRKGTKEEEAYKAQTAGSMYAYSDVLYSS